MHSQLRPWLLTYLADTDAEAPSGRQLLPMLHRRAADYFTELARRHPKGEWSLEVAYHCFAVGDATPAADWQHQLSAYDLMCRSAYDLTCRPVFGESLSVSP